MRIFVTGGTGFIGRYAVQELHSQGHQLLLLSRHSGSVSDADTLSGDLSDIAKWQKELRQFNPEAAIHLAWQDLPDYSIRASLDNLKHGLDVVTLLAEAGCRSVICAGSCWEYGEQSGILSEEAAVKPYNAFTAAKNSMHWLGMEIAKEKGMGFIWTRLFYVYGPGQRGASLVPHIINSVRQGKKPNIRTPQNRNDFVYVEDAARAIVSLVKAKAGGVYNIGSGHSTSVQEIVNIICGHFNFQEGYGSLISNSQSIDFWADISKIRNDTGWQPQITIEEGILKTINSDPCAEVKE